MRCRNNIPGITLGGVGGGLHITGVGGGVRWLAITRVTAKLIFGMGQHVAGCISEGEKCMATTTEHVIWLWQVVGPGCGWREFSCGYRRYTSRTPSHWSGEMRTRPGSCSTAVLLDWHCRWTDSTARRVKSSELEGGRGGVSECW